MENKYYTPSIEEFHIGFEFEMKNRQSKNGFANHVFTKDYDLERTDCVLKDILTERNTKNPSLFEIRVKYLDHEDIISLGWKEIGGKYFIKKENIKIWLTLHDDNTIKIEEEFDDKKFDGKIKNKSELKKLMQMLDITQ